MKLVGAVRCTTPFSAPMNTSGSIQFWNASWPELAAQRATHAPPGFGRGVDTFGNHLGLFSARIHRPPERLGAPHPAPDLVWSGPSPRTRSSRPTNDQSKLVTDFR